MTPKKIVYSPRNFENMAFSSLAFYLAVLTSLIGVCLPLVLSKLNSAAAENWNCPLLEVSTTLPFRCYKHDKNNLHLNKMDEARVDFRSSYTSNLTVYGIYEICDTCPCVNITELSPNENITCKFDTSFPLRFKIVDANNTKKVVCRARTQLMQYGIYELYLSPARKKDDTCPIFSTNSPVTANLPIYVSMAGFVVVICIWILVKFLIRRGYLMRLAVCFPYERLVNSDLGSPTGLVNAETDAANAAVKERFSSLDTFRGICLVVMIFVNYSGGGYWFFHHSAWNGLTVADLVFPWFTFIMGTSIALAFKKALDKGFRLKHLIWKIMKRTAILFLFGLMISNQKSGYIDLEHLRIPGVLQRLALTYFFVALVDVLWACRTDWVELGQGRWWHFAELTAFWPEWLCVLAVLALHLGLLFGLSVPGCPRGYLGPGGLDNNGAHPNCTGGSAGYVDHLVFGTQHIYQHPTCTVPFQTSVAFDPEGLLGTLTSIVMCFLGVLAGKILLLYPHPRSRVMRWLILAVVCGLIAGVLCNFHQNDGWIPVNKNLWSVSFLFALTSMAFILLSICYILVDVFKVWSGAPFIYPGMNSIVVYMCHEIFQYYFPIQFAVPQTHAAQLAMHLYGVTLWTIMAAVLHHKKIFIAI